MRRTKATLIHRRTGTSERCSYYWAPADRKHVRYLGVEVDDAREIAEKIDV